ncbi:MAG: putative DNA binding domain-containing protein [Lachnospiraceae bacterium]|nr:putative DNA binding domain-containing protein [Lachnospiraceae bacterium]
MNSKTLKTILEIGETVAVEFKRCGNGIESDTYDSVCSFLNRFGGDIFMGVLDDGTVIGVPPKAAPNMVKNFITVISNPTLFTPTIYLSPEIMEYEGHTIIHVHVPPSAEVHSYKKTIFDRVNDADVRVTATAQIAAMYIRKQNIFTEKKIYPYATINDLRVDLLPRIRQMAVNHAGGSHPWENMSDEELLRSAGLYGTDVATGESGYNLAAILLLGKDEVIQNVCPAYETDALVRKVNVDRYDDREIVRTNLIESFDFLMNFIKKHLPDKFFLEDENRVSLRNIIAREIVSNTLMHREYTSSYAAKLIIKNNQMYTENANRAVMNGFITPDNLEPNPKNPLIASFFRNIGRADRLGSGVHKLFKYTKLYSGKDPVFQEGDVFRIVAPLDDNYSFDMAIGSETKSATDATNHATDATNLSNLLTEDEKSVLNSIRKNPMITQKQLQEATGITLGTIKRLLPRLQEKGKLERVGNRRSGQWKVND